MPRGTLATQLMEQVSGPSIKSTSAPSSFIQALGGAMEMMQKTGLAQGAEATGTPGAPGGGEAAKGDDALDEKLQGIDQDIKQAGSKDDDIINTAFGHKVIRNSLPPIDVRQHNEYGAGEYFDMGSAYPGGDMMNQLSWFKWRYPIKTKTNVSVPPEEDWYSGARLGEYARPLIMAEGKVGYLNQAPVPMSETEDFLTLAAEAGVGSRRARHAALYAKASAGQAEEFYRLAQRRMRQVLRDPIITVRPGADVYPFYSASMPVLLAVPAPPQLPSRHRNTSRSPSCPRSQPQCHAESTSATKRALKQAPREFL